MSTAASAAALLPVEECLSFPRGDTDAAPAEAQVLSCVLLDLNCALPESCAGYEAALKNAGVRFLKTTPGVLPGCRTLIIPGFVKIQPELARRVSTLLREGNSVVLESGAGFADPHDSSEHQRLLEAHFDLRVEQPVSLWEDGGRARVPFVDYVWPLRTKVRDFSRVVPVAPPAREVIGWIDGSPVAVKRRVGKGTLIFLGSPLGPTLLSGDREAQAWLRELVSLG
jgi:hypothetical protein